MGTQQPTLVQIRAVGMGPRAPTTFAPLEQIRAAMGTQRRTLVQIRAVEMGPANSTDKPSLYRSPGDLYPT